MKDSIVHTLTQVNKRKLLFNKNHENKFQIIDKNIKTLLSLLVSNSGDQKIINIEWWTCALLLWRNKSWQFVLKRIRIPFELQAVRSKRMSCELTIFGCHNLWIMIYYENKIIKDVNIWTNKLHVGDFFLINIFFNARTVTK